MFLRNDSLHWLPRMVPMACGLMGCVGVAISAEPETEPDLWKQRSQEDEPQETQTPAQEAVTSPDETDTMNLEELWLSPAAVPKSAEVVPLQCEPEAQISGSVKSSDGGYSLNLSDLAFSASMTHKVDIDAYEDRCINTITLLMENEPGCSIEVVLAADGGSKTLKVAKARFQADSYCSNWPDDLEGSYFMTQGGRFNVSPMLIGERTAQQACSQHSIEGSFGLYRPGRARKNLAVTLQVSGLFPSIGDTNNSLVCPGDSEDFETRELGFEALAGGGATALPGAGEDDSSWDYVSPVLFNLGAGFRLGTRWFLQARFGSFGGDDMVTDKYDFEGRSLSGWYYEWSLGYRFRSERDFKIPVSIGSRASKIRLEYNFDIYSDYRRRLKSSGPVFGLQPTYQFAEVQGWGYSGFVSMSYAAAETVAFSGMVGLSASRVLKGKRRHPDER